MQPQPSPYRAVIGEAQSSLLEQLALNLCENTLQLVGGLTDGSFKPLNPLSNHNNEMMEGKLTTGRKCFSLNIFTDLLCAQPHCQGSI